MNECPMFRDAVKQEHRADPYPIYASLQDQPVREEAGRFIVTGYEEVMSLLHDPRVSSAPIEDGKSPEGHKREHSLLKLDPPDHDRLRRIMMRQFGPPHNSRLVSEFEDDIADLANQLIDTFADRNEIDLVKDFAHRLPFGIICKILDIPVTDEPKFHDWIVTITENTGGTEPSPESAEAVRNLSGYLSKVAESRRGKDGKDMLSGLVNDDGPEGRLSEAQIGPTAALLLIAGHETTVNLLANGALTLLRHSGEIDRLKHNPIGAAAIVEELLRFEPPVQFLGSRHALADIEIGETRIPAGSQMVLVLAAANRDARRFECPHQFDPGRANNQHLGFGSGIHSCFGAPLARLEGQIGLRYLFERLQKPRLVQNPPYRSSPLLRGPSELRIAYDGVDHRR